MLQQHDALLPPNPPPCKGGCPPLPEWGSDVLSAMDHLWVTAPHLSRAWPWTEDSTLRLATATVLRAGREKQMGQDAERSPPGRWAAVCRRPSPPAAPPGLCDCPSSTPERPAPAASELSCTGSWPGRWSICSSFLSSLDCLGSCLHWQRKDSPKAPLEVLRGTSENSWVHTYALLWTELCPPKFIYRESGPQCVCVWRWGL